MIKNAEFSGNYFYMKMNKKGDFQICISVPLKLVPAIFCQIFIFRQMIAL